MMAIITAVILCIALALLPCASAQGSKYIHIGHKLSETHFLLTGLVSLYRYWRHSGTDHFYTTDINEIGTATAGAVGRFDYRSEGIQCLIYSQLVEESVPLYRYFRGGVRDHFYTTNSKEIGTTTVGRRGNHGYSSEGIVGYCFPSAKPGTIPLYRYYHQHGVDHFYTTNPLEIGTTTVGAVGRHGYRAEGIACFVLPYYG